MKRSKQRQNPQPKQIGKNRICYRPGLSGLKRGSYFVSVTRSEITDEDAMLQALDNGVLAGVATDCGGALVGDTDDPLYRKMIAHPNVLATPHISWSATKSLQVGSDIMIDNVEAWIKGTPQNIVN